MASAVPRPRRSGSISPSLNQRVRSSTLRRPILATHDRPVPRSVERQVARQLLGPSGGRTRTPVGSMAPFLRSDSRPSVMARSMISRSRGLSRSSQSQAQMASWPAPSVTTPSGPTTESMPIGGNGARPSATAGTPVVPGTHRRPTYRCGFSSCGDWMGRASGRHPHPRRSAPSPH